MATVQVILKEKIANLGSEADIVTVKAGYARNFLVPAGKAFVANAGNLRHLNNLKARRSEREAGEKLEAQNLAGKLRKSTIKLELATGQGGKAFGSITTIDLAQAILDQAGVKVDRHAINLEKPIKTTGKHEITVRLHPEVDALIKITVTAPVEEEAAGAEETDKE
ncbi:MAG: 50S ribosomal protein L9 [Verrucomicrobiaceae bacterium]|nr:MAG: 50S ribosomal protein L9 [Verrucomicrobiaceae bacterium]